VDGIVDGPDHLLVEDLGAGDILADTVARHRDTVEIELRPEPLHHRRNAAGTLELREGGRSGGLDAAEVRRLARDAVEPVPLQRPAELVGDGGDVELVDVQDGIVTVRLQGACAGCPMSQMTLKNGIEKILKKEIPEIVSVESAP